MSAQLIGRSSDLLRLRNEGYELELGSGVQGQGFLLVKGVPYVNTSRQVALGTLVCPLTLAGDVTTKPATHVAYFEGSTPCDQAGAPLAKLLIGSQPRQHLGGNVYVDHTFSSKPSPLGYPDYYELVTTYVLLVEGPAQALAVPRWAAAHVGRALPLGVRRRSGGLRWVARAGRADRVGGRRSRCSTPRRHRRSRS